ncbi:MULTISPECIES: SusC/RagA family TonB-linked outer membrane protein [Sphingobacterium]|uniref:SusC/RagA family TonB-linked outer membrane protein n=1 Tax=Sphingobacterium TaxID=28453 RepID=UPI00257BC448|nr:MULTISPECIES: SusC/RagA family TonB-linked outer membrane protein [Sphingobacterium]
MQNYLRKGNHLNLSDWLGSKRTNSLIRRVVLTPALMLSISSAFSQQISLNARNMPMKEVFSAIKKQTGYAVFGNLKLLEKAKPVSVTANNMPLEQLLKQIFEQQAIGYRLGNKTIFLSERPNDHMQKIQGESQKSQDKNLSGTVLDSIGGPLPGASLILTNRPESYATKRDGSFSIQAYEGDVIVFTYMGYKSKQITVTAKMLMGNQLIVQLNPLINSLEEVKISVNTGYQSLDRERSAGSVAKPDMEIYNDRVGSMNVIQRLDGLIPGLTVNNAPGADPFQIRGLSTVGSTVNIGGYGVSTTSRSPLFVVDGVPYEDIELINPNDVLDVNVLKDATASSIWGARAANGVVVITTKAGKKGASKLKIDYNSFVRIQARPDLSYLPVMDSKSYIQAARETFDATIVPWATINGGTSPIVAPHEQALYDLSRGLLTQTQIDAKLDSMGRISNTDQISELFYRNNIVTNHSLAASGGTDKYSFYGSFNYTGNKNNGNRPDNSTDTYKLNIRQDFRFNPHINLYLVTDITNTVGRNKPYPTFDAKFNPYQLFQDQAGNNLDLSWRYMTAERRRALENSGKIDMSYVPLDEPNNGYTNSNGLAVRLNAGLRVNLYKGLRYEGTYSYTKAKNDTRQFEGQQAFDVRREVLSYTVVNPNTGLPIYYLPETGGRLTTDNSSREDWTIRNQFVYNKDWADKFHQLTFLAGNEVQSMRTDNIYNLTRGFNDETYTIQPVDYKSLAAAYLTGTLYPSTGGSGYYYPDTYRAQRLDTRLISYYANLAYSFREKYGVNASWRIDQSNLFGKDKSAQNKPVYSVGALWNMSKEEWMRELDWINEVRLRATYGLTGISPAAGTASSSDILLALSPNGYSVPGGVIYRINSPANRSLTWELTKTKNIGMDFRLFNQRVSGTFDAYWKKTDGLLDQMLVNPFAVAISPTVLGNAGELTNRGVELSLNTVNVKTRDFTWRTLINAAFNKNKITKSYNQSSVTTGNAKIMEQNLQGYAAYAMFAYNYAGLNTIGDPQVRLADGTLVTAPYVTRAEDIIFTGTSQPKWSGGFSNMFRYKEFDLQVNMVFNAGHVTRRDVNQKYAGVNASYSNFHRDFADRWKVAGDELKTDIPAFVPTESVSTSRRSVYYYILGNNNVINASFIKIRDLTLSYRLPKTMLDRIHCNELRIFGQVGNIMVWKANKYGIDPEFQGFNNNGGVRTLRLGQNSLSFGVNVSF